MPNCDSSKGGPPLAVVSMLVLYLTIFLAYPPLNAPKIPDENDQLVFNPYKKQQIWRYLTHSFEHINAEHLVINMVILMIIGVPLELVHSSIRITLISILGAIELWLRQNIKYCDKNFFLNDHFFYLWLLPSLRL